MPLADLYLFAAGIMAILAAAPLALAGAPAWLGVVGTGWVIGVVCVPAGAAELVAEHLKSLAAAAVILCLLAVAVPAFAFLALFAALLLVKSRELFGTIAGASILALGLGLAAYPSYPFAAAFLVAMVCACHFRVARALAPGSFGLAMLVLAASMGAGGLAALTAKQAIWIPYLTWDASAPPARPTVASTIAAILLLAACAYLLVRYASFRGRQARKGAATKARGRLVGEGEALETARATFSGAQVNEEIVRRYVSWRRHLADRGHLFRLDRTADEAEEYLVSRMRAVPPDLVARITELFNLARYSPRELSDEDGREFRRLTREVLARATSS